MFKDSEIKITTEGKRLLGASIGSDDFRTTYASEKVNEWCDEIRKLSAYAKSQPQAAYAAFCHGEQHKFTYFMRTIPGMEIYLEPLDELIKNVFLPSLLDSIVTNEDRLLYSLPVRYGGLGIPIFSETAKFHYDASTRITAPLVSIIVLQGHTLPDENETNNIKSDVIKQQEEIIMSKAENIENGLQPMTRRAVAQAKEKGASSWLSVIPLEEHGFILNKGEFRDAVSLRYNKKLRGLPSKCPCGQIYNETHALNCKKGGFVIISHNNVRDFEANLMKKVYSDVELEPQLQAIHGEQIDGLAGDNARPDIRARGVWRHGQNAYFDVRITNTNAQSQCHLTPKRILEKHEKEKKRQYNSRIMNIEHGTFTPLVFSVNGGASTECLMFHKHLAEKIATKSGERYEKVLTFIRCKLSFLILRSCLMCIRGSRSYKDNRLTTTKATTEDFEISCNDARCE